MKSAKKIGIWLDHATANIMEFSDDKIITTKLESTPAFPEQLQNLRMDESLMHNKEQNQKSDYYKKLGYIIIDYNEVLLFGPTDAKTELFNLLKDNRLFKKVIITVQPADNMSDNQQQAYVKDFFSVSGKK